MKVLIKTTDPALPSCVISLLKQHDILAFEFDQNVCIVDGSIGIFPRRIMVADQDYEEAQGILREAGLGAELEADETTTGHPEKARTGWTRAFYSR